MLRKTLKYDFRSSWRLWTVSSVVVTVMIWLSAFCIRAIQKMEWNNQYTPLVAVAAMTIILTVLVASVYIGGTVYIGVYRMYKSFFTDEGYLTFTLPVPRVTLYNSKLIHGISLSAASVLVVLLNLVGLLSIVPASNRGPMLIEQLCESLAFLLREIDFWGVLLIILAIVAAIVSFVFYQLLIYACLVMGCVLVRRARIIMAVGVYAAVSTASSLIYSMLSGIFTTAVPALSPILEGKPDGQITAMLILLAVAVIAIYTVLSAVAYSFSLGRIRHGLNLA